MIESTRLMRVQVMEGRLFGGESLPARVSQTFLQKNGIELLVDE
jgi:hypothetical protein